MEEQRVDALMHFAWRCASKHGLLYLQVEKMALEAALAQVNMVHADATAMYLRECMTGVVLPQDRENKTAETARYLQARVEDPGSPRKPDGFDNSITGVRDILAYERRRARTFLK